MLFSSSVFIVYFLPIVLLVYYGILKNKRQLQNVFLLIASLIFYAWGEPVFVLVMLLSIAANWFFGLLVDKNRKKIGISKIIIGACVVFNLAVLYIFKYLTFSINTITDIVNLPPSGINIALPIGISFFTFQAMSYVIDVYRGDGQAQKNVLNVGLYISLFPQLIAGPIVRYETVADQINNRVETADDFYDGFSRFVIGMAKKVLLANTFAIFADEAFANINNLSISLSWVGALSYTFQIFFDFSGYSDMAIGLGRMFGFHFLENFNYPYISRSITEFWRRWHISLGTWFRDYLYIPLGGSRVKKPRLIFNLFVVWMLTGIWHGANWTFFVWGFMYFVLIGTEKLIGFDKKKFGLAGNILSWIYTMLFVVIGWIIFRADSLYQAFDYIKIMFGLGSKGICNMQFGQNIQSLWIHLIFAVIFSTPVARIVGEKIKDVKTLQILRSIGIIILFVLSFASIISSAHNPFIYFNF